MEKSAKDRNDARHVRIVGDIIVIHADGMSRKQLRRLAVECFWLMRSMTVSGSRGRGAGQQVRQQAGGAFF